MDDLKHDNLMETESDVEAMDHATTSDDDFVAPDSIAEDDAIDAVSRVESVAARLQADVLESENDSIAEQSTSELEDAAEPDAQPSSSHIETEDSDALFDSDFDAVEEVLSAVFDTKASLVQHGESSSISVRTIPSDDEAEVDASADEETRSENVEPAQSADDDQQEAESVVEETTPGAQAGAPARIAPVAEEKQEDDSLDASLLVEETEGAAEETAVENVESEHSTVIAQSDSDGVATAKSAEPEPASVAEPAPAPIENDTKSPGASSEQKPPVENNSKPKKEKQPRGNPLEPLIALFAKLGESLSFIKPLLVMVNAPLKFVPPSLRPLVDYFALTLIMWVPIVWAIAWLVRK